MEKSISLLFFTCLPSFPYGICMGDVQMKKIFRRKNKKKTFIIINIVLILIFLAVLYFLPVRLNARVAVEQLYQYEDLLPEELYVEAESVLGRTYQVTDFELTQTDLNEVNNTAHLKNFLLQKDLEIEVSPLVEIKNLYDEEQAYAGRDLERSKIHVFYVYEDGHEVEKEDFTMPGRPEYVTGSEYAIETKVDDIILESVLEMNVVPIERVEAHAEYDWFTDDEVEPDEYTVYYADGAESKVEAEEVKVTSEDKIIQNGENTFEIDYHGLPYEINVFGVEKLLVGTEVIEKEDFFIDQPIPYDQLVFVLHFEDETTIEMDKDDKRITVADEGRLLNYGENLFQAQFKDQPFEFTVHAIEKDIESIEPAVAEAYIGETLKLSGILVNYEDGTSVEKTDFVIDQEELLEKGENECELFYHDHTYPLLITATYRPIVAATIQQPADLMEGDVLSFDNIDIELDNGTHETVPASDVVITSDLTMASGENTIHFEYHDQDVSFKVQAFPRTNARLAWRTYASEFANAQYRHISDNIYATSTKGSTATGVYWLTHVVINSPAQMRSGMSNDTFGGKRERPTKASKRQNWVVGTNGSYFNYSGGTPALAGVFIKDGQHIAGTQTTGNEMCLRNDGTLFTAAAGTSAEDLINQGVVQTWGTALPPLIINGVGQAKEPTSNIRDRGMSQDYNVIYPRTAYGMVKPCEYYIITAGEKSYDNGLTLQELIDIFQSKGCVYARALDGGGSSSLVFENTLVNVPCPKGSERAVADFVYFTE